VARLLANALAMALDQARVAQAWAYGKNVLDLPQMRMRTTIGTWTRGTHEISTPIFHSNSENLGLAMGALRVDSTHKQQWL